MSDTRTTNSGGGIGLFGFMFLILFALKLGVGDTPVVDWSWWLVTAPLWGGFLFVFAIFFIGASIAGIIALISNRQSKKRVAKIRASRGLPPFPNQRATPKSSIRRKR